MITETVGIFYMLSGAGPVVKSVLLLLLFFSITSWAIIFIKYQYVRKAQKESADFTDLFWQCRNLADAFTKAKALKSSPVSRVFMTTYMEVARADGKETDKQAMSRKKPSYLQIMGSVQRTINRAISVEVRRLSQLVPFLATVGNTAPFIGLFGTVWGIMGTFQSIGLSGSASLEAVAPGISEALVATAAGLAVAIPAVIFYNYFVARIKVMDSELQSFAADLLNIIERDSYQSKEG